MNEHLVKQLLEQLQTSQDPKEIGKLNITNTMLWMKKQAYEPTTIKRVSKELRHLERNCNTSNPEEVKLYIANKQCSNARKENLIESYAIVIKSLGLTWNQPFCQRYDKKRKAPKEELVLFIINHVRFEMKVKLKIFRDLGERPIETTWIKVQDVDITTGIVSLTGAKHTVGREGKLKTDTIELLKEYIKRRNLNPTSIIFNTTSDNLSDEYRHVRNRLAKKHSMPELKQVQLYDFRRRKASREYKLSGLNFLKVKQILGHKDSRSTEKYISLFDEEMTNWVPVKAITDEEKAECISNDYPLVTNDNGVF
ncbi:MAG TPA: site-specific integrase [Candidatus Sulfotelmatobacter sp.]|nr:site-specific integrase [Candidatus Sulfotelmatobacter sp.]